MKRLGLKYIVPKGYAKFVDPKTGNFEMRNSISLDTSRLKYRKEWSSSKDIAPEKIPSSIIMDKKAVSKGIPILSVVIDRYDLYDQFTGIFKNYLKKGRNWERPCYISYYDKGRLIFATGAGVRLHGGKSRSHKLKNIRLYFRDIYGADQFKPGILFTSGSEPLNHLVVRKTSSSYPFVNSIAFDICRKIDSMAPQTKPVKLYLNGTVHGHGHFVLIEHLSREYLLSHFGHDNFIFFRTKARKEKPIEYIELVRWAKNKKIRMTMEEAKKHIDIECFSRYCIAHLFCADSDPYQGLFILDKTKPDSKWCWINWDMDHSIRNLYEHELKNIWEQKKMLHEIILNTRKVTKAKPRPIIFRRLIKEDPEYRKYFEHLLMNVLNHNLTKDFLQSRADYYEKIAISFDIKDIDYKQIRLFFKNRHPFLMKLMQDYIGSPESYLCSVEGPKDIIYKIDGFISRAGYRGIYFKDYMITVEIAKYKKNISYWLINGKRTNAHDNKLIHTVNSETTIKPVFIE